LLIPVELILDPELFDGVEGVEGVIGLGAGILLIHTEGCPEQLQLF
jgi:hypothetical protein